MHAKDGGGGIAKRRKSRVRNIRSYFVLGGHFVGSVLVSRESWPIIQYYSEAKAAAYCLCAIWSCEYVQKQYMSSLFNSSELSYIIVRTR